MKRALMLLLLLLLLLLLAGCAFPPAVHGRKENLDKVRCLLPERELCHVHRPGVAD